MYVVPFPVAQDSTVYIPLPTRAADGGAEAFSASLEEADFDLHLNGSTTPLTLDASTITVSETVGSVAGKNMVAIDLSNDSNLSGGTAAGGQVQVWLTPDETVDSQTIAECIGVFWIESASEKALRLLRTYLYPTDCTISTTASNDTGHINLTDIVDAQTSDDECVGLILAVHDATDDAVCHVITTACASKVAVVELLGDGGAMNMTVAAGDHAWIVGYVDRQYDGTNLTEAGGDGDQLTEAGGTGDHLTAVPWNAAWDAEVQSEATDALNAYDPPTKAELDVLGTGALATAAALSTVDGNVDSILTDTGTTLPGTLATIAAYIDTEVAAIISTLGTPAGADLAADIAENQTDLNSVLALVAASAIRSALGLSAANLTAELSALPAATRSEMDSNSTQLAAIVADTNELQSDDIPGTLAGLENLSSAGAQTAAAAAITAAFGITTSTVNDASAATTGFTVTADVGTDIRLGVLRFTDGALAGESRLVTHTGTTVAVVQPTSVPAGLATVGPFSAVVANGVAYTFRPL